MPRAPARSSTLRAEAGHHQLGAGEGAGLRHFVLIGQTASATGEFSLENLPSSSGRLDALLRALRSALLVSHDVRRNVCVYLVLRGGRSQPRVLCVDGSRVKFLRPDERSLALLVKKSLEAALPNSHELIE